MLQQDTWSLYQKNKWIDWLIKVIQCNKRLIHRLIDINNIKDNVDNQHYNNHNHKSEVNSHVASDVRKTTRNHVLRGLHVVMARDRPITRFFLMDINRG